MSGFVQSALFVFSPEYEGLVERVTGNPHGAEITPVPLDSFLEETARFLAGHTHVVVSAPLPGVKSVLTLSREHGFSVGLIPARTQKVLRNRYNLPPDMESQTEIALCDDAQEMDLILINGQIMLFSATVGHIPVIGSSHLRSRTRLALRDLPGLFGLRLHTLSCRTGEGSRVETAACGCMLVQRHGNTLASRLVTRDSSMTDGMLSLVIAAPMSVVDYLRFLVECLGRRLRGKALPVSIGYIKTRSLEIETQVSDEAVVDGELRVPGPFRCEAKHRALRLNVGPALRTGNDDAAPGRERIDVRNLPAGRELSKARDRRIPLFGYASEERFRDLFLALRGDARIDATYVILMLLSTLLATVGLFLDSASVVIGAMLLAPLMAPIVSLSMGLVRQDDRLTIQSIKTILVGVALALCASAFFSLLITHDPVTAEMQARLRPSLLDLGVAILAGVAGAYTKSFREILQSLAGVAIAVALVPPLAVAGIGLGRGDLLFAYQAFLLFSTNLVGIILAAALTFRVLGYSPAVRNRRGMAVVLLLLALVSVPLYLSYQAIVETHAAEKSWQQERFLVGGKYLIVQKADLRRLLDHDVLYVDVLVREPLDRADLAEFKEKVRRYFSRRLVVRAKVIYIL